MPIELEAIHPDTVFNTRLKLDMALFSEWAKNKGINLKGENWLRDLSATITAHTRKRIEDELAWFKEVPKANHIVNFYQQLANSRTGNSQALLQLGWGTGWDDKTFGSNLRKDDDFMGSFIQQFRLARGRRERGEFFPKSRRVAVSTTRSSKDQIHETPMKPLGWVLLEIKPK